MNRTIAILGASGFIGRRLVSELVRHDEYQVRVLSRDKLRDLRDGRFDPKVKVFQGAPDNTDSLRDLLVPGCVVINLVYLWNQGEQANLACINALLAACRLAKVSRLIHCSTADVVGRISVDTVNEETPCRPISEYGSTKLKIEQTITEFSKNHFDYVILRPTSVFGIGSEALNKMLEETINGVSLIRYVKSCLFNTRRMHLIPLANVVAAIFFLIQSTDPFKGEIFIISNDEDPKNNFNEVEKICIDLLGVRDYSLPRAPIPPFILSFLLLLMGRSNTNPNRIFDSGKLHKLGFRSPVTLTEGLIEYITQYRDTMHDAGFSGKK